VVLRPRGDLPIAQALMALVLKAAVPVPPSDVSTEELELRRREQEIADYVEEEALVEPFPAQEIEIHADRQVYPRGAFLSHGAVLVIEGRSDCFFTYIDEHRDGKRITSRHKAHVISSDEEDEDSSKTQGELEAEKMMALLATQAAAAEREQLTQRTKPYWSRVLAQPKPVTYPYRSLIHSEVRLTLLRFRPCRSAALS
jgi:hypothetical protein